MTRFLELLGLRRSNASGGAAPWPYSVAILVLALVITTLLVTLVV